MKKSFEQIKSEYIAGLMQTNAFIVRSIEEEPFTLRSGKKSCMFLDHSRVASSPKAYKAFIYGISFLLHKVYGDKEFILCNIDSKISAQMVGSLAYSLDKPQIIFKSTALVAVENGTKKQLTGDLSWNLPVALPDDVMTGGDGTAKNVGDLIRDTFPHIKDIQIFVGFIREPKESTYKSHYLITRDELVDHIWSDLSAGQIKAIEIERKQT
jgi:orotate phosphoribosyltransferase